MSKAIEKPTSSAANRVAREAVTGEYLKTLKLPAVAAE